MTKYLDSKPFSVGGASPAFAKGWDATFGKKKTKKTDTETVHKKMVAPHPKIQTKAPRWRRRR